VTAAEFVELRRAIDPAGAFRVEPVEISGLPTHAPERSTLAVTLATGRPARVLLSRLEHDEA
jgi:hypothetical protein